MSVWLNTYFAEDSEFKANGREFWRTLQGAVYAEVQDCNRLYADGEPILRVTGLGSNCFQVLTGAGDSEKYVQLSLEPERLQVTMTGSFIPPDTPPYRISLDSGGLSLFDGDRLISFEIITRKALEPLLFPGGLRRVPV